MSEIDKLHDRLFGYVPSKPGTAYERIGAVVLASLGWKGVMHDVREQTSGRRSSHQLDVVARDSTGEVHRLLVECKAWNAEVGQGTLNAVVGVREQTGADAVAVLSTKGFTTGAIHVASDEGIALVHLDAYDPDEHGTNFAKRVGVTVTMYHLTHSEFDIELAEPEKLLDTVQVQLTGADRLVLSDGSPAEQLIDVLKANASPMQEGSFRRRATLAPGRFIPIVDGAPVEIRALTWTETNSADTFEIVHEAKGEPVLFIKELDEDGDGHTARLLISEDLFAWDIDDAGNVIARGDVTPAVGS